MPSELLIRPGMNDHKAIGDLLAPGGSTVLMRGGRPAISRLVVEAQLAPRRPEFARAAQAAGIPLLVDPLTPLLQGQLRVEDAWAQLPFGQPFAVDLELLTNRHFQTRLATDVIDFQLEMGATGVIAPYLYFTGPDDPRFEANLHFFRLARQVLDRRNLNIPLVGVVCAQAKTFGSPRSRHEGIEMTMSAVIREGVDVLAYALSPSGGPDDSYNKIHTLIDVGREFARAGVPTWAWRQGIYGEALVSAGLSGYETGIGTRERTDIAGSIARRKPSRKKSKGGGGGSGVFLEPIGRSLPVPVARALLADLRTRAKIMCDDESCCPNGVASTLDHSREHAIRTRARMLAEIDNVPEITWRFHRLANHSSQAATLVRQANDVLAREGLSTRLNPQNMDALARVAEHFVTLEGAA